MRVGSSRSIRLMVLLLGLVALLCVIGSDGAALARMRADARADPSGTRLPGTACPVFPSDNVWNTPITGLPVASRSAAWLAHMDSGSTFLHPDYGPAGGGASTSSTRARAIEAPTRFRRERRSKAARAPAATGTR
jgi:hypothetical protein